MDMGTWGHGDMGTWGQRRTWQPYAPSPYVPMSLCPYVPMSLCPYVPMSLEQESQTQLNIAPRVVLARHATERRAGRVAAAAARGRRCGDAVNVVEVRVVEEVEDLGAELHRLRPVHADILEERDIPLILARVIKLVSGPGAEGASGRPLERRRVDPEVLVLAVGELLVGTRLRVANEIPRVAERVAGAGDVRAFRYPQRGTRAHERGARDLPSTQRLADDADLVAIEGQIVDVVEVEHVTAIEARVAPEA